MDFSRWVDPDAHGWVVRVTTNEEWEGLLLEYGGVAPVPLERTLTAVRASGCRTVVVENRYVDADYRSEFSAFWTHRFESRPPFARRLHFFKAELLDHQLHRLPRDAGYLGYAVIRPLEFGPLGRTMIVPPPSAAGATLALARDEVTLFGNRLQVDAAPFCQQDGEYLCCAHAAAWMCHYPAARRSLVARQLSATFVQVAPKILSAERALPSKGLTLIQLQAVFGAFDQPALFYGLGKMPRVAGVDDPGPVTDASGKRIPPGKWDTRIFSVVCRYINSGYPVLIATEDHAFVIVGWSRDGEWIRFLANDDQRGPYQIIDSPFIDERGTWQAIMVPLPPSVLLSGESAENRAHYVLRALGSDSNAPPAWRALSDRVATKDISLRAILRNSSDFKVSLDERGVDEPVVRLLRLARLPRYVWVVEAHDRAARRSGDPCVLAEVVFDSTSSDFVPRHNALLMPMLGMVYPPDGGAAVWAAADPGAWKTSLPTIPELPAQLRAAS